MHDCKSVIFMTNQTVEVSKVFLFDTFLSAEERYRGAASFTRKVDIFEKDFLFIPVCRRFV